jgi:gliding motility-associated-like protein
MLRQLLFSIITLFFVVVAFETGAQEARMPFPLSAGQDSVYHSGSCGTDLLLASQRKDPRFKAAEENMNRAILAHQRRANADTVTLPVVFHVVDENPAFFSDVQVQAAINDLNDAFSKSGAYGGSTGVDTKIRFCLARQAPDGGITTGITRTTSFFANDLNPLFEDARLKNLVQWDPSRYINIWYIRTMHWEITARFQCGTWLRLYAGGYATMPPGGGPTDGIVVTGLGTMLAHEMGHYLGLYHTFEGLSCQNWNCTTDGDRVCDTPPDSWMGNSAACNLPDNSCTSDTLSGFTADVPDDISNFMDYGNDACHNKFTQGQADRMQAAIATQRPGLLQNKCSPPCTESIAAAFSRNNHYPLPNDVIQFTNLSTGAATYEWLVNGTVTAATANFSTSFGTPGKYRVTLKAYNGGTCFSSFSHDVIVTCGVTARFFTDKREIASIGPKYLDSIRFSNTSVGAATYQWLMRNDKGMAEQVISTAKDFVYVFAVPANYTVRLIATNGGCADTTASYFIPVTDPTPDGSLYITGVDCYQETKVRVSFFVCNNGFGPIPEKTVVSFYDGDPRTAGPKKLGTFLLPAAIPGLCCGYLYTAIFDVGYRKLNTLFGVFNDSSAARPLVLPNTSFDEKDYRNNIASYSNFAFRVLATPPLSVMEWGDTVQLRAQTFPTAASLYTWTTAKDLTCTSCQTPLLIADSTTSKQVVATSIYGCTDTARVAVQVPPYNDFSVVLDDVQCAGGDSLAIRFTIKNSFKRAVIPKGLTVAFYKGDPTGAAADLLPNLFSVKDTVKAGSVTYTFTIKGAGPGKIYAVSNDSGKVVPVALPTTAFLEKGYSNNIGSFDYPGFTVTPSPLTATLEWGDTLQLTAGAGPGLVSSYTWATAKDLSCTTCQSPLLVADSTTIKQVVAMNIYGCSDTALVDIQVPPYNDFSLTLDDVQCRSGDSLQVWFTLKNSFKRAVIPKGLTVAFYKGDPTGSGGAFLPKLFTVPDTVKSNVATFTTTIKGAGKGKIYAAVNDSGKIVPVVMPASLFLEKGYGNNFASFDYTGFSVQPSPLTATLEWRDTLALTATAGPGIVQSFTWSNIHNLSCTACASTVLVADTTTTKTVVARSALGCTDTASVSILVPPYNDFSARITEVQCARGDSLFVSFSLANSFKRPLLPKGLSLAFYTSDPTQRGAQWLPPLFTLTDTLFFSEAGFSTFIKGMPAGTLYAAINDSAKGLPLQLPTTGLLEKAYANNVLSFAYSPEVLVVQPADTTVFRKSSIALELKTTVYNAASTLWQASGANTVSCGVCESPLVAVYENGDVSVQTENRFGCLLQGKATVKIFPPDFRVTVLNTSCFTNDTAMVTFRVCQANGYDSLWQNIPVSFYDGNPATAATRLLSSTFRTRLRPGDTCATFTTKVLAPRTGGLVAVVNDKGDDRALVPNPAFTETDMQNNGSPFSYTPFAVSIVPRDTAINRLTSVQLAPVVTGGTAMSYLWQPAPPLSCASCPAPVVFSLPYTTTFSLLAQNEAFCTDTAVAIVRSHSQAGIYVPTAFTPNGDGRNDVLYVMAGAEVARIKSFSVFNRWGQRVFTVQNVEANTPLHGWRGTVGGEKAPPETYVYYVEVEQGDGKRKAAKGTVVLIR